MHFTSLDFEVVTTLNLFSSHGGFPTIAMYHSCAYPESFVRGGPTLTVFFLFCFFS